ncbi:hypothetical protein TARUN_7674 [Trichoderma arundinaceum]|uniref:Uncharacterized protein n=1 Tax=Trichoderma arundinaceum TaxID=490622 RepID=A0A395NF41_TRIAR|nr:hypothetical protein TARUN_7674 [Trichoderma arundinaceum]
MADHRYRCSTSRSTAYHQDEGGRPTALPSASNHKRASSQTSLISSWLQHVQPGDNGSLREVSRQPSAVGPKESSWRPNGLPIVHVQPDYDTRRDDSSDLFIRDSPLQSLSASPICYHGRRHQSGPNSDNGKDLDNRKRHCHSKGLISTPPGATLFQDAVFERRPRRKTRQNRYDTVKLKAERIEKDRAKKPSVRVSKKRRLHSSREIMANFKSRAIANPNERITPDENERPEKEQSSNPNAERLERDKRRQDDIELFTNALRRLKADYPPPESPSPHKSRGIPITSGDNFQSIHPAHAAIETIVIEKDSNSDTKHNEDNNGGPPPDDNHTSQSRSVRNHPTTPETCLSDSNTQKERFSLDRNIGQGTEKEYATMQQGLNHAASCQHAQPFSRDAVERPKYEDKGVMVSPWMHQRTEDCKQMNSKHDDYQFRRQTISSRFDLEPQSKDASYSLGVSSAWLFDNADTDYLSHSLHPHVNTTSAPLGYFEPSNSISTQPRDAYSVNWPVQPATPDQVYRLSQEAFQDTNVLSSNTIQVDDIPGESLKDYIERMELEILGTGEPSSHVIDDVLLSVEEIYQSNTVEAPRTHFCDDERYPDDTSRSIQSRGLISTRSLMQRPIRQELGWTSQGYLRREAPAEDPDHEVEPELASFWRPNHMMWY